jgi:hypothetical protein
LSKFSIDEFFESLIFNLDGTKVRGKINHWQDPFQVIRFDDILGKKEASELVLSNKVTTADLDRLWLKIRQKAREIQTEYTAIKTEIFTITRDFDIYKNIDAKSDKDIWIFLEKETGKIVPANSFAMFYNDSITKKDELNDLKVKAKPIKFVYEPAEPYGLIKISGKIQGFNLFRVIEWDKIEDISLPACFVVFFNHLIPDENQRKLVFSWAHFAEFSRLDIAPILYGPKGAGKSTFIEILKRIYMPELVVLISDGYFDNKFSGEIENKKLGIIEEVTCRGMKAKSKLKSMMNDFITIERKGENPRSNVQSFCNFIFTTNYAHSIEVEPDDRRFFAPDLTKGKADTKIIAEIYRSLADMKILKAIRKYFADNLSPDFDPHTPFKDTHAFWEMVRESANDSIDFILTELEKTKGQETSYMELRTTWDRTSNKIKGRFIQRNQLLKFLEAYKPFGKQYVTWDAKGQMFKIEDEPTAAPAPAPSEDWDFK